MFGLPMRVFRCSPGFHVDREPSIVLVWFQLPKLQIHYFNKECLFQIVRCLDKPLFVDAATVSGAHPSVARVRVEVDLIKAPPSRI